MLGFDFLLCNSSNLPCCWPPPVCLDLAPWKCPLGLVDLLCPLFLYKLTTLLWHFSLFGCTWHGPTMYLYAELPQHRGLKPNPTGSLRPSPSAQRMQVGTLHHAHHAFLWLLDACISGRLPNSELVVCWVLRVIHICGRPESCSHLSFNVQRRVSFQTSASKHSS